ncbi:MAG: hypothetical protein F6K16_35700, partial [Symploca sp. SIO2B6]|nr:hypothetical protein [Symploca sp. SIO2B6]
SHSQRLVSIHRQLLDRALRLVKPGGIVVYSTCTFAPEENEAVIDGVVGDRGVLEPYAIAGLEYAPGLLEWEGQSFRADCGHAHRYWPHLNNTGGFFVARIRRTDRDLMSDTALDQGINRSPKTHNSPTTLQRVRNQQSMMWMSDRFGIDPEHLEIYNCWSTGQEKEWLASPACIPPANVTLNTIGIPFVRHTPHGFKPTTAALQRLGTHVKRQHIDLTLEQGQLFVAGEAQQGSNITQWHPEWHPNKNTQGFIHVRSGPYELGCGRWRHQHLYCELPKTLRLA